MEILPIIAKNLQIGDTVLSLFTQEPREYEVVYVSNTTVGFQECLPSVGATPVCFRCVLSFAEAERMFTLPLTPYTGERVARIRDGAEIP